MFAIRTLLLAGIAAVSVALPAMAQEDVIRIGLLGGENEADRLADNQCLIDKLPAALGVKEVKLFPAADYDGVVQGLLGGTLDVAGLGASAYAKVYLADPKAVAVLSTTWRMQQDLSQLLKVALEDGADPEGEPKALKALLARAGGVKDFRALKAALAKARPAARAAYDQLIG